MVSLALVLRHFIVFLRFLGVSKFAMGSCFEKSGFLELLSEVLEAEFGDLASL